MFAVDRERFAIALSGFSVVALEACDIGEVHEVGSGRFGATGGSIDGECGLERVACACQVSELLGHKPKVILIGRHPARVSASLAQPAGARVQLTRASHVAAILAHAAERADGVAGRAVVADALREVTRPAEVDLRTVVILRHVEPGADVAHGGRDSGGVVQCFKATQALAPRPHCGVNPTPSQCVVPRASNTVGGELGETVAVRECAKPRYLPNE